MRLFSVLHEVGYGITSISMMIGDRTVCQCVLAVFVLWEV